MGLGGLDGLVSLADCEEAGAAPVDGEGGAVVVGVDGLADGFGDGDGARVAGGAGVDNLEGRSLA